MTRFILRRLTSSSLTVLAVALGLTSAQSASFEPPVWAGEPGTEFSEWDVFATADDQGNTPDVAGSSGNAVLRQLTPGALVTGSGNIYNPAGTSVFTISDSFSGTAEIVVFEATTSGTELDTDSVKLQFNDHGAEVSLATAREELERVSGGQGDSVTSRWMWPLRGRNASSIVVAFSALGPHCSLANARLDVRFKPDVTDVTQNEPSMDRWNYPYNATPGTRSVASTFQSPEEGGIVRHGHYVFAFDTDSEIPSGHGEAAYEIVSARITLTTSSNFEVAYDPTDDSAFTYLTNGHPQYVEDNDPGRPLELFGAGFRNGFTSTTWTETTDFAPTGGERTVYPATWDANGDEIDASMNVNFANPFELAPFAIGQMTGVNPGENIPFDSPVTFDVDLTQPGVVRYLQNGLNSGRLFFSATSLHAGGQGVRTFPEYYTRDSLVGTGPTLALTVRLYDRQETVMITTIQTNAGTRTLRFPSLDGRAYGIRWSIDLKNWYLVREPALATPEAGMSEWQDSESGDVRFYQVYLKP